MRKKATRRNSSRKPITKPTAKGPLQIAKETIRTLTSDELTQAATGVAKVAIGCPWNSDETRNTQNPGDKINH